MKTLACPRVTLARKCKVKVGRTVKFLRNAYVICRRNRRCDAVTAVVKRHEYGSQVVFLKKFSLSQTLNEIFWAMNLLFITFIRSSYIVNHILHFPMPLGIFSILYTSFICVSIYREFYVCLMCLAALGKCNIIIHMTNKMTNKIRYINRT